MNISDIDIIALMRRIQQALDTKDLPALLEYYHPDIIYIGPAFTKPISGIDNLKASFESHFQAPQRTRSECTNITIHQLPGGSFAVISLVEGRQIIYYSEQRFKGWLSRVFAEFDGGPKIMLEHFTLLS